jgi:hypothetical protein
MKLTVPTEMTKDQADQAFLDLPYYGLEMDVLAANVWAATNKHKGVVEVLTPNLSFIVRNTTLDLWKKAVKVLTDDTMLLELTDNTLLVCVR